MARTKEQLIEIIVNNKEIELIQSTSWQDLVNAVGNMTQVEKDALLATIVIRDNPQTGYLLYEAIKAQVRANATAGVTTLLNDDNLSLTELDLVL